MKRASYKAGDNMPQNKRGRPATIEKRVLATNLETNEQQLYSDYREAARAIGANRGNVYLCLEGIRKSHKGYRFEYTDS